MTDRVELLQGVKLQHGKNNDRVYIMSFPSGEGDKAATVATELARQNGYGKIFAKVPADEYAVFKAADFRSEAKIPGYFDGRSDALFMCRYFDKKRAGMPVQEQSFYNLLPYPHVKNAGKADLNREYALCLLSPVDLEALAGLYRTVFTDYPFPVFDPAYLLKSLEWTMYVGVFNRQGRLIAAASAEIDTVNKNAEVTDFAVHPDFRGQGLALRLLQELEFNLKDQGIKTAYTIARLKEPAMNATFAKSAYEYTGTLVQNTRIMTGIESMNVWYKPL